MAEMLIDGAKLDACNTAEADAIRAKTGGTDPIPYDFANNKGFADAIAAIETGGGGVEHHQFTHAEDWLTDATGNGNAFYNTYLSQLFSNKNSGFGFAVITNNNATQYKALYTFRNFALINKSAWMRSSGAAVYSHDTGMTNLSFYISAGSIIDVYIMEVAAT